jgi:hypothetical protein
MVHDYCEKFNQARVVFDVHRKRITRVQIMDEPQIGGSDRANPLRSIANPPRDPMMGGSVPEPAAFIWRYLALPQPRERI